MIRRPPRSTLFPSRRSSDLRCWDRPHRRPERSSRAGRRATRPSATIRCCSAGRIRSSARRRSEEHTSELQPRLHLVCRLLLEKKKKKNKKQKREKKKHRKK